MGSTFSYPGVKREADTFMRGHVGKVFPDKAVDCNYAGLSEYYQFKLLSEMREEWPTCHFSIDEHPRDSERDRGEFLKVQLGDPSEKMHPGDSSNLNK